MKKEQPLKYSKITGIKPENTSPDEYENVKNNTLVMSIINSFPHSVLIISKDRKIIAANKAAFKTLNITSLEKILGIKVGKSINCIRHKESTHGCDTTDFCTQCGANKAINITKTTNAPATEEWRVITEKKGKETAFNCNVHTDIINVDGMELMLFVIQDISTQKRIEILEKMFFHDILNTSGALQGLATLFRQTENEIDRNDIAATILESTNQLIEEINSQKDLVWAEKGDLEVKFSEISVNCLLKKVYESYAKGKLALGKIFEVSYLTQDFNITTDSTLLIRSLANLVKNALEASRENDVIKIYPEITDNIIKFNIYNNKVIIKPVQLQIFQKSFSTKNGLGRGIGIYSVKLLVEQFLNGKVYFISNPSDKTIFTIELPLR